MFVQLDTVHKDIISGFNSKQADDQEAMLGDNAYFSRPGSAYVVQGQVCLCVQLKRTCVCVRIYIYIYIFTYIHICLSDVSPHHNYTQNFVDQYYFQYLFTA